MGLLVPEDFDRSTLVNDAERAVVDAFVSKLSSQWLVLPSVGVRGDKRDHELDVVLIHQHYGIVDIEVKGHRVQVVEGRWTDQRGLALEPAPTRQAIGNSHTLADLLRTALPAFKHLKVAWGIAFPNTSEVRGALPPEVHREQVLTATELEDPTDPIEVLASTVPMQGAFTHEDVQEIVELLRPDVEFAWDPAANLERARRRLDERCESQVQVLQELDANRRVVTLGAAGTGKTRLAMAWARRAYAGNRRVLLTCYNEPLADHLVRSLHEDPDLRVGPFLRLALSLEGMPELAEPADDADATNVFNWWTDVVPAHLEANWDEVTERFDTVIIDEAQDFDPAWIALLERLLDPDDGRLLVVADPAQNLYPRGYEVPSNDDGWTVSRLVTNCRNAVGIGQLLRRKLHGAPSPGDGPGAVGLEFVAVDRSTVIDEVAKVLARLRADGRDPTRMLVLTFTSDLRDRLRDELGLRSWEQPGGAVVCENVHRVKGLESDTVILVAEATEATDALLYVGVSRAVSELVVVAPAEVGDRLGFEPGRRVTP